MVKIDFFMKKGINEQPIQARTPGNTVTPLSLIKQCHLQCYIMTSHIPIATVSRGLIHQQLDLEDTQIKWIYKKLSNF